MRIWKFAREDLKELSKYHFGGQIAAMAWMNGMTPSDERILVYPNPVRKAIQCKDIPEQPILDYLDRRNGEWAFLWGDGGEDDISTAFPKDTPRKLMLAKLGQMIKKGLIDGCTCGCRGDFEIVRKKSE